MCWIARTRAARPNGLSRVPDTRSLPAEGTEHSRVDVNHFAVYRMFLVASAFKPSAIAQPPGTRFPMDFDLIIHPAAKMFYAFRSVFLFTPLGLPRVDTGRSAVCR